MAQVKLINNNKSFTVELELLAPEATNTRTISELRTALIEVGLDSKLSTVLQKEGVAFTDANIAETAVAFNKAHPSKDDILKMAEEADKKEETGAVSSFFGFFGSLFNAVIDVISSFSGWTWSLFGIFVMSAAQSTAVLLEMANGAEALVFLDGGALWYLLSVASWGAWAVSMFVDISNANTTTTVAKQ